MVSLALILPKKWSLVTLAALSYWF